MLLLQFPLRRLSKALSVWSKKGKKNVLWSKVMMLIFPGKVQISFFTFKPMGGEGGIHLLQEKVAFIPKFLVHLSEMP